MSSSNFSKGPDGDLIYYPKACKTAPTSKGDPTKWLEVKHEVKDYKPEEIMIKVTNSRGKIDGNHKTKFSSKSFYKEFVIPNGVDIKQLDISLGANGILSIFAPIGKGVNASGTRSIQTTTQSQDSVQSKSKQDHTKVSQAVSRTSETTRRIQQVNVSEFSSDELNNSRIEDISREIKKIDQGSTVKRFETRINVKEYSAENLQVKISQQMVVVSGKIVTESTIKEFIKKFSIPSGVEPENITNSLDTTTGILTISAPINETNVSTTQKLTTTNLQQLSNTQQQQILEQERIQQRREINQTKQQQLFSQTQQQITGQEEIQQRREISQTQQQQLLSQTQQQVTGSSIQSSSTVTRTTTTSQRIIENECTLNSTLDLDNRMQAISDSVCENVSEQCIVREGDALEVNIELPDFAPEDIEIRVTKTTVIIIAKREIREHNRVSIEEIYKKFSIPYGIRPEDITSILQTNGILRITNSKTITTTQQQTLKNKEERATPATAPTPVKRPQGPDSPVPVSKFSQGTNTDVGKVEPTVNLTTEVDIDKLTSHEDLTNVIREDDERKTIEVNLNVSDFKRDEVNVKIYKRVVIIEARKKITNTTTKPLLKKLIIPDGVRPEQISCDINPSGILTITAPTSGPKPKTPLSDLPQRPDEDVRRVEPAENVEQPQPIQKRKDSKISTVESIVEISSTDLQDEELQEQVHAPPTDQPTKKQQKVEQTQPAPAPRPILESPAPEKLKPETLAPKELKQEAPTLDSNTPLSAQKRKENVGKIEPTVSEPLEPTESEPLKLAPEAPKPEALKLESHKKKQQLPEEVAIETLTPETQAAEALQPEVLEPDVVNPEALKLESRKTERRVPVAIETEAPETPDAQKPGSLKPETLVPEVAKPEVIQPEVIKPEVIQPEVIQPEVIQPEVIQPEVIQPEVIQPEVIQPDSPAPVSTLPERQNEDVGKVEPTVDFTTEVNNEELKSHEDLTNVIQKVDEGNKVEVMLNVSDFKRDEVKVTIYKRTVIIEARKKTNTTTTTTLLKKLTIPDEVRPEQISCNINPSGILTITAPTSSPTPATDTPLSPITSAPLSELPQRPNEDVGKVEPTVDLTSEVNNEELKSHEDLTNVIRKVDEGKKIEVNLNVSDFKRDEVKVTIYKRTVIIEARKKTTTTTTTTKTLLKKLTIPDGVRPEQISFDINPSGILTITAPTSASEPTSTPTPATDTPRSPLTSAPSSELPQRPSEDVGKVEPTVDLIKEVNNEELKPHEDLTNVIRKVDEGNKIEVKLNVSDFKRDEVKVTIYRKVVIIEARKKTTTTTTTMLLKKFTIPDGVRPEQISSDINPSGILTLTAPTSAPKSDVPLSELPQRPDEDVGKVEPTVDLITEVDNDQFKSYEDLTNVIRNVDKENKIEVNLNVSDFKRDEVKVTIYRRIVIIEVRKNTTTTTTTTKTLLKKLTIPDDVRPDQISCDISPSGILTITAPTSDTPLSKLPQRPDEDIGRVQPTLNLTTDVNNEQLKSYEDLTNVIQKVDKGNKIEVNLNVSDFKRDEVKITIYKRIVVIEVRRKTTTTTTTTTTTKTLLKKLTIPDGVRPEQILCEINSSGILTITAPVEKVQNITDSKISTDRSKNLADTRTTQTTSKKSRSVTLKTSIVSADSLAGYDFDNATATVYDPADRTVFEESVEINEYSPEEIEVKMAYNVQGFNWVIIDGNQEMTKENGYRSKSFTQMFTVPEGAKLETIECTLDLDENNIGLLTCTAPIDRK